MPDAGLATLLYLAGFLMVLFGAILLIMNFLRRGVEGKGGVGGVILIGPFPIIFGSGSRLTRLLMVISILLMVGVLLIVLLPNLASLAEGFQAT
ncbi:MAG: membrane protein [Candidatus Bathyarchaeota archaeon B26-1]|nr:MAG: membrane protein [Candidatus Bathyarchaeota archaeon B26-1]